MCRHRGPTPLLTLCLRPRPQQQRLLQTAQRPRRIHRCGILLHALRLRPDGKRKTPAPQLPAIPTQALPARLPAHPSRHPALVASEHVDSWQRQSIHRGGGNSLIYNLLYGFGDNYLWFIKIILIQYLLFDIFIAVQNRCNKLQTLLLINLLAAIGIAISLPLVSTASIVSIPLFYYGVLLSRFDKGNRTHFLTHFGMLIFWAIAICIMLHLKGHATINAIINYGAMLIATIIMLKLDIRRPLPFAGFLGAISFDLYLIHGKCLTFITHQYPQGALPIFLLLAATATLLFHLLRTRLKL